MQVQTLNKHAVRKFTEFEFALTQVDVALAGIDLLLKQCSDPHGTWSNSSMSTVDELKGMHKAAGHEAETLRAAAKKYQSELMSKGWRV